MADWNEFILNVKEEAGRNNEPTTTTDSIIETNLFDEDCRLLS